FACSYFIIKEMSNLPKFRYIVPLFITKTNMKRALPAFLCLLSFLALPLFTEAQAPVNYNDVGVIVNVRSKNSVAIAGYFVKQRNIPAANIIMFNGDSSEVIDSLTFEQIRKQIEDTIKARNLTNKLNYLVTTKGVPLKVTRGDTCNARN